MARPEGRAPHIGTLNLTIPGRDGVFGRRVAERVGALVCEQCPAGLHGRMERIALRIRADGLSEEALSQAIADAILAAMPTRQR